MNNLVSIIVCICLGLVFITLATTIDTRAIEQFDTTVIHVVQGLETPLLTTILKGFTWIGKGTSVAFIAVIVFLVLFFIYHNRREALLFGITIGGTGLLNLLLKLYFQRERPDIYRIMDANGFSFPSGHAMAAFSLYTIGAYLLWPHMKTMTSRLILVLLATFMILVIAVSRIYLGVHYPSDILGGFVASAFWLTLTILIFNFFDERQKAHSHR